MKRVVVLGGSGFVGRALCRRLVARWPALCVVVPTRRAGHAQALRPLPTVLTPVADVHDAATLANLLTGADAVVNLWPSCTARPPPSSGCMSNCHAVWLRPVVRRA